jgi:hypothetical protein
MDVTLKNRLTEILVRAGKVDWSDPVFSSMKAHVCAELAAIVYEDVQEHEIKKSSRVHLFASETYKTIVASGNPRDILKALGENQGDGKFFLIRGRYSTVLGTIFNNVVILAVRGTVFRRLWDWKANVDAAKLNLWQSVDFDFPIRSFLEGRDFDFRIRSASIEDTFFHRGFFESIIPQFGSIADQIRQNIKDPEKASIIWTGHSLGGAMAAIGNAVSASRMLRHCVYDRLPGKVTGAYTFGMPRYGGVGTVCSFPGPHHIYKAQDLIPTVPLRRMGFSDSCREYELTDAGLVALTERTDTFDLAGHVPNLLASLKAHKIEGYAESLAKVVNLSRP